MIIKKQAAGGINIIGTTKMPFSSIVEICKNHSIYNATIEFHEDINIDYFDDLLNSSTVFMPLMIIKNNFKNR